MRLDKREGEREKDRLELEVKMMNEIIKAIGQVVRSVNNLAKALGSR